MIVKGKIRNSLAIFVILTLLPTFAMSEVFARHYDPPSTPALSRTNTINSITLAQDQDDGFGDAEILIVLGSSYHQLPAGHGSFEGDINWDTSSTWTMNNPFAFDVDCTSADQFFIGGVVIEADTSVGRTITEALASAVAGGIAGSVVPGVGTVGGAVIGGAVGVIVSASGLINGNDDLGVIAGTIPPNGQTTIATAGADGGTSIVFTGTTGPNTAQNQNCQPPQTAQTPMNLNDREINFIFGNLTEAVTVSQLVEPEEGNPAMLTESDINNIRQSYLSLSLGTADFITAHQIDNARHTPQVDESIEHFNKARSLASEGLYQQSLESYENAYATAYYSNLENEKLEESKTLPFQIILPTEFINIKENAKLELPIMTVGNLGEVKIDTESELETEISTLSQNMFKLKITADQIGKHSIKFTANDQTTETSNQLVLIINERQMDSEPETQSPRVQMEMGIDAKNVICKGGFTLMIKNSNGNASCVTPETAKILEIRNWGTII